VSAPTTCAAVDWDMRDDSHGTSSIEAEVGDLVWNPKAGEGHVLAIEAPCGSTHNGLPVDCGCGGWGLNPCPGTSLICECGEDNSSRDHHYVMLARGPGQMGESAA
jgi:hypothetical protein